LITLLGAGAVVEDVVEDVPDPEDELETVLFSPPSAPPALLSPLDGADPTGGKHVTTYATCRTASSGSWLSSAFTGSATSDGNRAA